MSFEARLEFSFDRWTGLVGAYYFESNIDTDTNTNLLIRNEFPFPVTPNDSFANSFITQLTDTENYALFTQWRFETGNDWAFDFGLRYDDESYSTQQTDAVITTVPDECEAIVLGALLGSSEPFLVVPCSAGSDLLIPPSQPIQSDDFAAVLPRFSATYYINEDMSVFAGARRGYRAGGTFLATSNFGSEFQVVTYDPEFLTSVELGWRSQWLEKRLTLNATAFYSDYKDQQVSVLDQRGFTVTVNAGETSLYGAEFAVDYLWRDGWSLFGNIGLLETNIDEFLYDEFAQEPVDLAGNDLDRAPAVSMTLGLGYDQGSGIFGDISVNYRSEAESDIFNLGEEELGPGLDEEIAAATVVNARLGYRFSTVTLTLFATNLLDEDEPELNSFAGVVALTGDDGFFDQGSYTVRQPRTVGVSVDVTL